MLFLPRPDAFQKFLAAEIVPRLAFVLLELPFDHHLRRDARVVGAGEPEDFLAVHARLAAEDVLDGGVEDVAHVEHAGDVWRRNDNGMGRTFVADARRVSDKTLLVEPELVPLRLDGLWLVRFRNFAHENFVLTTFSFNP